MGAAALGLAGAGRARGARSAGLSTCLFVVAGWCAMRGDDRVA